MIVVSVYLLCECVFVCVCVARVFVNSCTNACTFMCLALFLSAFSIFPELTLAVWHYLSLIGLLFAGGFLDVVAVVAFSGGSVHEQIFKACKKKYDPDDSGSIDLVNFVASIKAAVMAVS